jgi:hypothetical protein
MREGELAASLQHQIHMDRFADLGSVLDELVIHFSQVLEYFRFQASFFKHFSNGCLFAGLVLLEVTLWNTPLKFSAAIESGH